MQLGIIIIKDKLWGIFIFTTFNQLPGLMLDLARITGKTNLPDRFCKRRVGGGGEQVLRLSVLFSLSLFKKSLMSRFDFPTPEYNFRTMYYRITTYHSL